MPDAEVGLSGEAVGQWSIPDEETEEEEDAE